MSYESLISSNENVSDLSGLGQTTEQGLGQKGLTKILKKLEVLDRQKSKGATKGGKGKEDNAAEAVHVSSAVLSTPEQWRRYETLLPDEVIRFGKALIDSRGDGIGGDDFNGNARGDGHSEL